MYQAPALYAPIASHGALCSIAVCVATYSHSYLAVSLDLPVVVRGEDRG